MARVKLSEFRAKNLLAQALGYAYEGVSVDVDDGGGGNPTLNRLPNAKYAVKVDQATKKRNQLGLVKLNRTKKDIAGDIAELGKAGFRFFLVEPMVEHAKADERFLALIRTEEGIEVQYSEKGGVDIEEHPESVKKFLIANKSQKTPSSSRTVLVNMTPAGIKPENFSKILGLFNKVNMVYLEINPLLVDKDRLTPLDAAVEVDSTAELAVQGAWTSDDVRSAATKKTDSEKEVEELQATSAASLTLRVLNPDGKILLLLSGGGASLVVADEFDTHGLAGELINYGDYSGNPNEDELYHYTLAAIKLIKASKASKKIIVIAGGVANFTDIAATFKGIIRAFEKEKKYLKDNNASVFVRRGGPNQQKGLKMMEEYLSQIGLKHKVHGPNVSLAQLVEKVAEDTKR